MAKRSFVMKNIYKAKWCASHGLKPLSKWYMLKNSVICNAYINYNAQIPLSTHFSHRASGVVINETAVLGENVTVAHGVTIGNRMPTDGLAPHIGNNVYIGSGAYLGGSITIGDNAKIGANAVVIHVVPENYTAVGNPARIIPPKTNKENL